MRNHVSSMAAIVMILAISPAAQAAGTAGAAFLDIPVGARPAAMGSAYSAMATDAYAPVWNPAGMGFVRRVEIAGQHNSYLESIYYEYAAGVMPFKERHALGFSAQVLGSGDIPSRNAAGDIIGEHSDSYGAYSAAYAFRFSDQLSLGLTGKWIRGSLADFTANAFGADLGGIYRPDDRLNLSMTVANLGSKLKFIEEGDPLPLSLRWGAAYRPWGAWTFAGDAAWRKEGPASGHVGIEWQPVSMLALRTGCRTDNLEELSALAGFSTGLGVTLWGQELAYAWAPFGGLGSSQYISLVARFGAAREDRRHLIHSRGIRSRRADQGRSSSDEHDYQQLMHLLNEDRPKFTGEFSPPASVR